jgi:23S rRNA pseudoU1915 N3-methylase RlmH
MVLGVAEVMTGWAHATAARQTRAKKSRISFIVVGSGGVKSLIQSCDRERLPHRRLTLPTQRVRLPWRYSYRHSSKNVGKDADVAT